MLINNNIKNTNMYNKYLMIVLKKILKCSNNN